MRVKTTMPGSVKGCPCHLVKTSHPGSSTVSSRHLESPHANPNSGGVVQFQSCPSIDLDLYLSDPVQPPLVDPGVSSLPSNRLAPRSANSMAIEAEVDRVTDRESNASLLSVRIGIVMLSTGI